LPAVDVLGCRRRILGASGISPSNTWLLEKNTIWAPASAAARMAASVPVTLTVRVTSGCVSQAAMPVTAAQNAASRAVQYSVLVLADLEDQD